MNGSAINQTERNNFSGCCTVKMKFMLGLWVKCIVMAQMGIVCGYETVLLAIKYFQ